MTYIYMSLGAMGLIYLKHIYLIFSVYLLKYLTRTGHEH